MISPGVYFFLTPWRHSSLLMLNRFMHKISKETAIIINPLLIIVQATSIDYNMKG